MVVDVRLPLPLTGGQKTVSSRDSESLALSVDWLGITFKPLEKDLFPENRYYGDERVPEGPHKFLAKAMLAASIALGCTLDDWVWLDGGKNGYRKSWLGPAGAVVWYDPPGADHFHIQFSGQSCAQIGQDRLRSFIKFSLANGGNPRRCDVTIDDYARVIEPEGVLQVLRGPHAVTRARKGILQEGFSVGGGDAPRGITVYLGQPTSRQRLRVYDKGLESGGVTDCVRWELQTRRQAAESLVPQFVSGAWGPVIARRLVSFVDFRDADSHSEVEKRARLPWFGALVGLAERANVYPRQLARTVGQVVDWLRGPIAPSLAVAVNHWRRDESLSGDFLAPFMDIIRTGEQRMRPKHFAMLAAA